MLLGTAERALRAVIKRGGGGLGKRMLVLGLDLFAVLACLAAEGVGMESAEIYAPDALETDRAAAEACGCVFTGEFAAGGYDIVLVSDAARENVEWAWRASCPQGRLVFAVPPELADLPAGQLLHHEMTVTGVGNASWDYERALRLVVQNAKRLSAVRTRWIDAADFSAAVEAAEEKMTAAAARWDL